MTEQKWVSINLVAEQDQKDLQDSKCPVGIVHSDFFIVKQGHKEWLLAFVKRFNCVHVGCLLNSRETFWLRNLRRHCWPTLFCAKKETVFFKKKDLLHASKDSNVCRKFKNTTLVRQRALAQHGKKNDGKDMMMNRNSSIVKSHASS